MFKMKRGINVSYPLQGYIHFTCLTYSIQPEETQDKIRTLCKEVANDYYEPLFEMITTEKTVTEISMNHYISPTYLYVLRKRFYEKWR